MDFDIVSNSAEETIEIGRKIGEQLKGGEVIGIRGALGSGKTHLIKGIAAGAGAEESSRVTSPTFVIVNEYKSRPSEGRDKGRLDVYHIDAYRLDTIADFEMLGFDDFCYAQSVVVIEWADKIEEALRGIDYIRAELCHAGETQRTIHIRNAPAYIKNI